MNTFITKLNLIFRPYLLIAVGFITLYTFLHWLLVVQTGWLPLKENVVNIILPIALPIIPLVLWLRPRVKLLNLKRKRGKDLVDLYLAIAWISIFIPTAIAQEYMITATGKLTVLQDITELNDHPLTKYYTLDHHYIDKNHVAVYKTANVSGRNNEYLNLSIYVACPVLDPTAAPVMPKHDSVPHVDIQKALIIVDRKTVTPAFLKTIHREQIQKIRILPPKEAVTLLGKQAQYGAVLIALKKGPWQPSAFPMPVAWLGLHYNKQISNHLSPEEKEKAYKEFGQECDKKFGTQNLDDFEYLDRIGDNSNHDNYIKAVKRLPFYDDSRLIFLEAKTEPFEARNGHKLGWLLGSFGIGASVWLILLLFPSLRNA